MYVCVYIYIYMYNMLLSVFHHRCAMVSQKAQPFQYLYKCVFDKQITPG